MLSIILVLVFKNGMREILRESNDINVFLNYLFTIIWGFNSRILNIYIYIYIFNFMKNIFINKIDSFTYLP
jgi:hypothetical protein